MLPGECFLPGGMFFKEKVAETGLAVPGLLSLASLL